MTTSELPPKNHREPVERELNDIELFDHAKRLIGAYVDAISSTPEFDKLLRDSFWGEPNDDVNTNSAYNSMLLQKGDTLWLIEYQVFEHRLIFDKMKSSSLRSESVILEYTEIDPSHVDPEDRDEVPSRWGEVLYKKFLPNEIEIRHQDTDLAVEATEKLLEDFKSA